jgi:hypothetical protein
MAKQSKVQRKVKAGRRARKGKACPQCGRKMKVGVKPVCQFHKEFEGGWHEASQV